MTVSLIITTYNWVEALELSIKSALNQSRIPDEIIIADDGSSEETKNLIDDISSKTETKIIHSWQEDLGFRAAKSRNLAISKSSLQYIICVDGDMILDKYFIEEHLNCAEQKCYIQGSRVLLQPEFTDKIIKNRTFTKPHIFSKQIKNLINSIHCKILSHIVCNRYSTSHKGVRSCNFSFYKKDLIEINGFNEDFNKWGREDSEFIERLYNIGVKRKNLKFGGIQYHLYHKQSSSNDFNDFILENAIKNRLTWCDNGIDKYL